VLAASFAGIARAESLLESLAREMRGYCRFNPSLGRPETGGS